MTHRSSYAAASAAGKAGDIRRHGKAQNTAKEIGTAALCLFPPAFILYAVGYVGYKLCRSK